MEVLLNAGLGIGAMLFVLLLVKKNKRQEDYIFLCWILATLLQIAFYDITIYRFDLHGFWAIAGFGLPLLGAPLLFLYVFSLTGHYVSWPAIMGHLGVYPLFVTLLFLLQEHDNLTLTAANGYILIPSNPATWMFYYAIPLAVSGLLYCIWDVILLRRHQKTIGELFSFDERINLDWLRYVVFGYFALFILASFFVFGATQFQLFPLDEAFALVGILLSFMLIAFGFYGFRQTSIFSDRELSLNITPSEEKNDSPTAAYAKSGLDPIKIERMAQEVAAYMDAGKPYLNENLSLTLLAEQFKCSQTQLSQIINQHFQMSFYDFINSYRIELAKEMLGSSNFEHLSILGIAFECGFKSKSSFNRYFKKYTGVSPSEFKKK